MTVCLSTQQLNTRKTICRVSAGLIVMVFFFCFTIPMVNAGIFSSLKEMLIDIVASLETINSQEVAKIFNINGGAWKIFGSDGVSFFQAFSIAVKTVAASLFTLRLIIRTLQAASEEKVNLDYVLKTGVSMAILLVLITNIDTILTSFHTFFSWAIQQVSQGGLEATQERVLSDFESMIANLTPGSFITMLLFGFLGRIILTPICMIMLLLVRIGAYSLMIELGVRRIFMPMALISLIEDGQRNAGFRFLKKYMAVYIKMMIYIATFYLADNLSATEQFNTSVTGVTEFIWWLLKNLGVHHVAITLAAYLFAKKSETLADEIMGVNG